MQTDYDVAIVGGGMVGASLACALSGSSLRVALIEAIAAESDQQPSYDDRGLSLSLASHRILAGLSLWPSLLPAATPIEHIHVSDRGRFGFVRLHATDLGLPALGYVVLARDLGRALLQGVRDAPNVDFLCPARVAAALPGADGVRLQLQDEDPVAGLGCRLLVVADGTRSSLRESLGMSVATRDYHQVAIVATVTPQKPHGNWAFERFTDTGPLALLPLRDGRCVLVHAVPAAEAEDWLKLDDEQFLGGVQARFGRRLGRLLQVGTRKSYPLLKQEAREQVQGRVLLLGNAAHTLHPNGAQGFNLGLRDVAGLAEHLTAAGLVDPGARQLLQDYVASRRADQRRISRFTDGLTSLFYNNNPAKVVLRDAGMLLTDLLPGLKKPIMRLGMGVAGRQPGLVLGDALREEPDGH
jgi:2-octaprenyl-6-methoxyphenol hydroxylase